MRIHWSFMTVVALVVVFPLKIFTKPLYNDFEPITDDKKQVLLEIFDALFVPTINPTIPTIREDIEKHFGPISRTGVDYILAHLGYIHDADIGEMERSMVESSHIPETYQYYCQIHPGLRRLLHNARNVHEWLNIIARKTKNNLPITKAFISDLPNGITYK